MRLYRIILTICRRYIGRSPRLVLGEFDAKNGTDEMVIDCPDTLPYIKHIELYHTLTKLNIFQG